MTDRNTLVREYYRRIDAADYGALADLLAPSFVHERPDRTLCGRDRFVAFTRDDRPHTDTTHVVEAVYDVGPGDNDCQSTRDENESTSSGIVVQGRLLDADDERMFTFVDVFTVADDRLHRLETYVRSERGGD